MAGAALASGAAGELGKKAIGAVKNGVSNTLMDAFEGSEGGEGNNTNSPSPPPTAPAGQMQGEGAVQEGLEEDGDFNSTLHGILATLTGRGPSISESLTTLNDEGLSTHKGRMAAFGLMMAPQTRGVRSQRQAAISGGTPSIVPSNTVGGDNDVQTGSQNAQQQGINIVSPTDIRQRKMETGRIA